jgi:hypothetical protein
MSLTFMRVVVVVENAFLLKCSYKQHPKKQSLGRIVNRSNPPRRESKCGNKPTFEPQERSKKTTRFSPRASPNKQATS